MKQVSESVQNANAECLQKAYKALNNSISCETNVTIRNELGPIKFFNKVSVVLGIGGRNSYMEIECEEQDLSKYKTLGLHQKYLMNEVILEFEDFSDYQTSVSYLTVKPMDSDSRIIIGL